MALDAMHTDTVVELPAPLKKLSQDEPIHYKQKPTDDERRDGATGNPGRQLKYEFGDSPDDSSYNDKYKYGDKSFHARSSERTSD
jgi:hypothetical protein